MNRLDDIRKRLSDPELPPAEVPQLKELAEALHSTVLAEKDVAEIEKVTQETANIRRLARSEALRFWIPVLAPTISAVALVATLLFQIHQLNESMKIQDRNIQIQSQNTELQRRATEDTQFRSALQVTRMPARLAWSTGTILLRSFLKSEFHNEESRAILLGIMSAVSNPEEFRLLFEELFRLPELPKLPEVVRVGRSLERTRHRTSIAVERYEKAGTGGKDLEAAQSDLDSLAIAQSMIGKYVADCLRLPRDTSEVDLSGILLHRLDLSGIDFRGVGLSDAMIQMVNIKDANLSKVGEVEGSTWYYTAWWRARRIGPKLIDYLEREHPYDPKMTYFADKTTRKDYVAS